MNIPNQMFEAGGIQTNRGAQSVSTMLLSLGLVFSVATQLRLPGLPLGLGELLLLLWLLVTFLSKQNSRNPMLAGALSLVVAGALLLGVGYFLTSYPPGQSRPPALHDALAYAFCAMLTINYARLSHRYESSLPVALIWAFLLSALVALVFGVIAKEWSGVDAMYYHTRWQHLSNNPNQFALLALPLPYLALHLILRQHSKQNLMVPIIAYLLALALGLYSQSDALTLAWIGGGLVSALALLRKRPQTFTPAHTQPLASHARHIAALLIMLMVAVSSWQFRDVATGIIMGAGAGANAGACSNEGLPQSPSDAEKTQGRDRLCLWRNGLAAIEYAPLTGMGPGPHSGFQKPFEGKEAHNSLLDWGTQTGLAGVAVLTAYLLWLLWQVARRRQYELTAMLLALYCFAMFHDMLRQPLFWLIPLLAWGLAVSDMQPSISGCPRQPAAKG